MEHLDVNRLFGENVRNVSSGNTVLGDEPLEHMGSFRSDHVDTSFFETWRCEVRGVLNEMGVHEMLTDPTSHFSRH